MTAIAPFSRIIYFGDSLTDTGTIFDLSSQVLAIPVPPAALGYDGQFSDGDVYADIAPELLGADVENFGVGGARAIGEIPFAGIFPGNAGAPEDFNPFIADPTPEILGFDINLGGQVDRFLASEAERGTLIPGSAASFLIGLNDLNNFTPTSADPDEVVEQALALSGQILFETLSSAFQVAQAGVQTIIFNTLPDATFFPSAAFAPPEVIALGESIIPLYNFNLSLSAQVLQGSGIDARVVDFNAIAGEIEADPTAFGFVAEFSESTFLGFGSNPGILPDGMGGFFPAFPSNTTATDIDPDQIAFIDLLHPTTATHGILGAFQARSLTNVTQILEDTDDVATGAEVDDLVLARGGNDTVTLGLGNDVALGGLGDDVLNGNAQNDILSGGSGNDRLIAGRGTDFAAGGQGDDFVSGGVGNDILIGGLGSDTVNGGGGNDALLYTQAEFIGGVTGEDTDLYIGGAGNDTLFLVLDAETQTAVEGEIVDGANVQQLASIGVTTFGVENFVLLDTRAELEDFGSSAVTSATVAANVLEEANLWGLI